MREDIKFDRFEVIVTPNIFSVDETQGIVDTIIPAETYDKAIKEMQDDIERVKDSPIANLYHYNVWEYDDEDDIIGVWVFDWKGNPIEDMDKWLENLPEEELQNPNETEYVMKQKEKLVTKLYWVSAIIQNEYDKKAWLCAMTDGVLSLDKAMEVIERTRENHKVLSAWVDVFDENKVKQTVFHECYINVFGNLM